MLPFYEPRRPERLPTKSRARTQASSRATIRLRRRSPSCALCPILPGRRGLRSQGGQDGPARKEACWKPLSTPGTRIPRILRRSRRSCAGSYSGKIAIAAPNWHGLFGTVKALLLIQKRSSRWEYISAIVEAISGVSEPAPRPHGATRTSCSAVVFGALRLPADATETVVGLPNTFRAPCQP